MTHDLEFAQIEIQVIDGLKQGNEALKKVNEVLNLEDIERMLEETREGVEKQRVNLQFTCGSIFAFPLIVGNRCFIKRNTY